MKDFKLENRVGEIVVDLVNSGYSVIKSEGVDNTLLLWKGDPNKREGAHNCGYLKLEKDGISIRVEEGPGGGKDLFKVIRDYLEY